MNPLIKSYLDQIDAEVADLAEHTGHLKEELAEIGAARDELRKEVWSKDKELSVQKSAAQGFAELRERNAALEARETELRAHLAKVLGYTKALTEELRQ